jgi:hypothetical protein
MASVFTVMLMTTTIQSRAVDQPSTRRRIRSPKRSIAGVLVAVAACALTLATGTRTAASAPPASLVPLTVSTAAPQGVDPSASQRHATAAAAQAAATPTPTPTASPQPLHVVVVGPLPVNEPSSPTQQPSSVPRRVIAPVPAPGGIGGILPPVATLPAPAHTSVEGTPVLPVAALAVLAGVLLSATLLLTRRRL